MKAPPPHALRSTSGRATRKPAADARLLRDGLEGLADRAGDGRGRTFLTQVAGEVGQVHLPPGDPDRGRDQLADACRVFQREIARPFLMPWHLLPDTRATDLIRTLRGHTDAVFGVTFSPDGRRLVSASQDHTVKIWDVDTGYEALTLRAHADAVRAVVSPRAEK